MRLLIVGGGKVSFYLIKQLKHTLADIIVVEQRSEVSVRIANELGVTVYHGDGTNRDVLAAAGCKDVDVFIALTGKDENNLVACQLAKHDFAARRTIAKLNNPKNSDVFRVFGVDRIFSGTAIIADMIDHEIEYNGLTVAYNIPGNTKYIIGLTIDPRKSVAGKALEKYRFPGDTRVVLITSGDTSEVQIPQGSTVMHGGDHMLLVCDIANFDRVRDEIAWIGHD